MAQQWKTIRVFISSTFKDMHAERDYLVRHTFPELKARCRKYQINLIDVDLRWGVSEKDAQDGKALDICLDEIDSCRPFFIGLLGHRYGWVPLPSQLSQRQVDKIATGSETAKLLVQAYRQDSHGEWVLYHDTQLKKIWVDSLETNSDKLLRGLQNSNVDGAGHSITASEIYHGVLHNDIPEQIIDLDHILQPDDREVILSPEQVQCLHECYQRDGIREKFLLREEISEQQHQIIQAIFKQFASYQRDRSFFFFRSKELTTSLSKGKEADFFESEQEQDDKLTTLKEGISEAGLPCSNYDYIEHEESDDLKSLAGMILDNLWQKIKAEALAASDDAEVDSLIEETKLHDLFMADRTRRFVGRHDILQKMADFCSSDESTPLLVVTGEPGCGKSALMSRFTEQINHDHPDWLVIPHFIGASPSSTNLLQTLHRLCSHLQIIAASNDEIPEDIKELVELFPNLLNQASEQNSVLIILDAVNQLEKLDDAHAMRWLPTTLPDNVKIVISTLTGETQDNLLSRHPQQVTVRGLDEKAIKKFVHHYLQEIHHEFPNQEIEDTFFTKIKAGHPLYIQVALEELRVFGQFEDLAVRVASLPDNVPALFEQVLGRIEHDFSPELIRDCLSFIACGRQGMTAEELQTLLKPHTPKLPNNRQPDKLPDMLWRRLYLAFNNYLFERSGVIDFFHVQLKEAVGKRYLTDEAECEKYHGLIGNYFEARWKEPYMRSLDELPHQRMREENWQGLEKVLTDLEFIEAKCAVKMTSGLLIDYYTAVANLDRSKLEFKSIEEFRVFFQAQSHILAKYPGASLQQAANEPDSSLPCKIARKILTTKKRPWINWKNKPQVHSACIITIGGHLEPIAFCTYSPDGTKIISASEDQTIKIWNAETGIEIRTLIGHSSQVNSCAYSPDGLHIVSASSDHTLKIWDAETGTEIRTLVGHSDGVKSCAYSPDGLHIVSASSDHTLKIWDAETGIEISTLKGHSNWVYFCSYSCDGNQIISASTSASYQGNIKVWNVKDYTESFTIECFTTYCSYSPRQRLILASAVNDNTHFIWNAENGEKVTSFVMDSFIFSVSFSPVDTCIAIASESKVKILDLERDVLISTFAGHTDGIRYVSYSPNGKQVVSCSEDKTIRVWNATSTCNKKKVTDSIDESLYRCYFSPNSKSLVSSAGAYTFTKVWHIQSGEQIATLSLPGMLPFGYSPDGNQIVGADIGCLIIWDTMSGAKLATLLGGTPPYAYSPDGNRIISASKENTIKMWDVETGVGLFEFTDCSPEKKFTFSPDGRYLIYPSNDNIIRVIDAEDGSLLNSFTGDTDKLLSLSFSPDGRRIISFSQDKTLRIWDFLKGEEVDTRMFSKKASIATVFNEYGISNDRITLEAGHFKSRYKPDSNDISPLANILKLSYSQTREIIGTFGGKKTDVTTSFKTSPNGCFIAIGCRDGVLQIYDANSGKQIAGFIGTGKIKMIDFSTTGLITVADSSETPYFLELTNFSFPLPRTTPLKLYNFKESCWENKVTCLCQWCSVRFPLESHIINIISALLQYYHPHHHPSFNEISIKVWGNTMLKYECPHCRNSLWLNPFIIDYSN